MSIYNSKTIFKKITHVIDGNCINNIVKKYNSDFRFQHFDTKSHIYSMLYFQLSETKSLRGLIDKLQSNTFNEDQEEIRLLTNIFDIPAEEIINLYKLRWKIEVFFKWIKQNLRIKQWLGFNANAVKIQVYSALIAYLLLALLRLDLDIKMFMLSFTRMINVNLLEHVDILSPLSG